MSAALRVLHSAGRTMPKPPTVPPSPAPGREPFCLGQPVSALRSRVEMAQELLRLTGRPFDWDSAVADYMVETDGGREEIWSLTDRAARWGWSLSREGIRKRMARIREDAGDRADLYRSRRANHAAKTRSRPETSVPHKDAAVETTNPPPVDDRLTVGCAAGDKTGAESQKNGDPVDDELTRVDSRLTDAPHIPRASDHRPQTSEEDDAADAGGRASRPGPGTVEDLPDSTRAYAEQITERLGVSADERRRWALTVIQPRGVLELQLATEALGERAARAGPLALAAALVVVENEGVARRSASRLNHLDTILASIESHARTRQHPPAGPDAGADRDAAAALGWSRPPGPSAGPPGGRDADVALPARHPGRGPTGDGTRLSAAERAGTVGPRTVALQVEAARALRRERLGHGDPGHG